MALCLRITNAEEETRSLNDQSLCMRDVPRWILSLPLYSERGKRETKNATPKIHRRTWVKRVWTSLLTFLVSKSRRAFAKKLRRSTSENKIIAVEWKHARNSKGNDWRNKLEAFDANGTSQGPVFSFRVEGPRGRRLSVSITPVDRCRGSIGRNFTRKVVASNAEIFGETPAARDTLLEIHTSCIHTRFSTSYRTSGEHIIVRTG